MTGVILAGEDCWIEARNIRSIRTGELLNVTGYSVLATACALYNTRYTRAPRYWVNTPVVAEWSTSPTGTQGEILAGTDTIETDPYRVEIHVTPQQSSTWRCPLVLVQAEMIDPVTGYTGRIVDKIYEVNFEICR